MPGGWCLQILGAVLYQVQNRGWEGGCLSEIAKRGLVPRTIFQAILDLKSYKFCHFVEYLALSRHQSSSYTTLRAWIMHFPVLRGFLDGAVIYWVSSSADRSNSGHLSWNLYWPGSSIMATFCCCCCDCVMSSTSIVLLNDVIYVLGDGERLNFL